MKFVALFAACLVAGAAAEASGQNITCAEYDCGNYRELISNSEAVSKRLQLLLDMAGSCLWCLRLSDFSITKPYDAAWFRTIL